MDIGEGRGFCQTLAKEFIESRGQTSMRLSRLELETFGHSPFFTSARGFYRYRLMVATYMSVVLFVSLFIAALNLDGTLQLYFIYYTRWSLLLVTTYLILAAKVSRQYMRRQEAIQRSERDTASRQGVDLELAGISSRRESAGTGHSSSRSVSLSPGRGSSRGSYGVMSLTEDDFSDSGSDTVRACAGAASEPLCLLLMHQRRRQLPAPSPLQLLL